MVGGHVAKEARFRCRCAVAARASSERAVGKAGRRGGGTSSSWRPSAEASVGQLQVVLSEEESKETSCGVGACRCAKSRNTISGEVR